MALLLWERFDKTVTDAMDACIADLETYAGRLTEAAVRDNERWNYPDSYKKEIGLFRTWITGRRRWMTAQFASPRTLLVSLQMYRPSETMEITDARRDGDTLTLKLSLKGGAPSHGIVLVNGIHCGILPLTEEICVPLPPEAGEMFHAYDAVQVLGCDSDGTVRVIEARGGIAGCDVWDSACLYVPK